MKWLNFLAQLLVIIGAINWGMVGIAHFDLVASLFGGMESPLSRIVYSLVGISGIYSIRFLTWMCGCCSKDKCH